MFQMFATPQEQSDSRLFSTTKLLPTLAEVFAMRSTRLQNIPAADKNGNSFSAAVANAGLILIGTVSASLTLNLHMLTLSSSVAGRLTFFYNSVGIWDFKCPVNQSLVITFPPFGVFFTALAGLIQIQNNTGGAADISGGAAWAEVVP